MFEVSISSTSEEVQRGVTVFPLCPQGVSISSTSEEVQSHLIWVVEMQGIQFPLVQLPKKFKARLCNSKWKVDSVSISSTSEEVQSCIDWCNCFSWC